MGMSVADEVPCSSAPFDSAGWFAEASQKARLATCDLARTPERARNLALFEAAASLQRRASQILSANAQDLARFDGPEAFRDRLMLDPFRIEAMASSLMAVAALRDPLNRTLASWTRPNGLRISQVAVPIGVIGMIYESRPNVGVDAAGLCTKSGNAIILRGGSESIATNAVIYEAMLEGIMEAGLPSATVQIVPTADRSIVAAMLVATGSLDLLIPRGGKSLVERVQREARVPVLAHAEGLCHTFIHSAANLDMARAVLANAKLRRPGICSATETLLVDETIAAKHLPSLIDHMSALGCLFRADARARAITPGLAAATEDDYRTEWHDKVLSIAVVDGVEGAIAHINRFGSAHTDAIITEDAEAAQTFLSGVNSAVAMWNASTQFCDGGEFGYGAEIGISTGRLHARGPIGLEQLTTVQYQVVGNGQVRP